MRRSCGLGIPGDNDGAERRAAKLASFFSISLLLSLIAISMSVKNFITKILIINEDFKIFSISLILLLFIYLLRKVHFGNVNFHLRESILISIFIVILCYFSHKYILYDSYFIRDERMALFDAFIFAHGHLVWPLPLEWRHDAAALNTILIIPAHEQVAWVSAYLPMHAALRAAVGLVIDPDLTSPLLTGLSCILLWACSRQLWPDDREASSVSLILFVCSGQLILTGMTAYAMAAHLFFNLLWLWLFLMGRRQMDLLALLVGFVATGLHQPLFHPLFVAPWMLFLLWQRQWSRFAIFCAGYALICSFWLTWPNLMSGLVSGAGAGGVAASHAVDVGFWARLAGALASNTDNIGLMAANLVRFWMWQHLLLVPLMLVAWKAIKTGSHAAPLALGFVLPILVVGVILPWQGFGFGYRYLHPVLGNAALLGGFGWQCLGSLRERFRGPFVLASVFGALILVPYQALLAHRFFEPYAKLDRAIEQSGADYAVLGSGDTIWTNILIHNQPDLSNRPIRIQADQVRDYKILAARICHPGAKVALPVNEFYHPVLKYFHMNKVAYAVGDSPSERFYELGHILKSYGCAISALK